MNYSPLNPVKAEKHATEIKKLLTDTFCRDSIGRIRAWKSDTWFKLNELGHTSLDIRKCKCHLPDRY